MTEQSIPPHSNEILGQSVNPHQAITELFKDHARPKIVSGGRASMFLRFTQELTCTIPSEQGERVIKIVTHGKPHQPESVIYTDYRIEDTQNPGLFITVKPDEINTVTQDSERSLGVEDQTRLTNILQSMIHDIRDSNTHFTSEYKVENPSNVAYSHTNRGDDTLVFDVPRMRVGDLDSISNSS